MGASLGNTLGNAFVSFGQDLQGKPKSSAVTPAPQAAPTFSQPLNANIQPTGKGGRVTYPGMDGQPQIGQPNNYSNTIGPWDNASIGNQNYSMFQPTIGQGQIKSGKSGGKGV